MNIDISKLSAAHYKEWDTYMSSRSASLYHDTRWIGLIESVFGQKSQHLMARNSDGKIIGGLPLVQMDSWLFGKYTVSMPYFNYGGVVADNSEIAGKLIEQACEQRQKRGSKHLELRFDRELPEAHKLKVREDKVTMLLDLPESADTLWQAIGSKRRAQVKRPIREGAEFIWGGEELLDEFYVIFSRNMRDLGTPVYGKRFFQEIFARFGQQSAIALVRVKGEPAGAGFLLHGNKQIEIPWASTMREFNRIGVNMFLYWNILKTATEKQFKVFDFGRSSKDAGTLKFKRQWGAVEKQLYWYYALPEGEEIPLINHSNKKYELLINTWKKLPVAMCNLIGPHIVRGIP